MIRLSSALILKSRELLRLLLSSDNKDKISSSKVSSGSILSILDILVIISYSRD